MSGRREFKLTLVRHGQTVANKLRIIQGHLDTPLTELGVKQAEALGALFAGEFGCQPIRFNRVYSSDSGRAYKTCIIIVSRACPSPDNIITDRRLRERCYGHRYQGLPIDSLLMDAYKQGFDSSNFTQYTPEGVESMDEVRKRVEEFCRQELWANDCDCKQSRSDEEEEEEEVLVVSHWATIKEFLKLFQDISDGLIKKEHLIETPNVSFSRFKIALKPVAAMATDDEPLPLVSAAANHVNNRGHDHRNATVVNGSSKERLRVEIEPICLHQTPHLSEEQVSVNMKQQVD